MRGEDALGPWRVVVVDHHHVPADTRALLTGQALEQPGQASLAPERRHDDGDVFDTEVAGGHGIPYRALAPSLRAAMPAASSTADAPVVKVSSPGAPGQR